LTKEETTLVPYEEMEPQRLAFLYELYKRSAGDPRQGVPCEELVDREEDAMAPIRGVSEVAIRVRDLARADVFYRDVLRLETSLRDERQPWVF
jgi:hypothetical protein